MIGGVATQGLSYVVWYSWLEAKEMTLSGPDLIRWELKRDWALPGNRFKMWKGISKRETPHCWLWRQRELCGQEYGELLGAKNSWLTASKAVGSSVLKSPGTKLNQWPEWNWKQILPWGGSAASPDPEPITLSRCAWTSNLQICDLISSCFKLLNLW